MVSLSIMANTPQDNRRGLRISETGKKLVNDAIALQKDEDNKQRSQSDIASLAGITDRTFRGFLKGEPKDLSTVSAIAQALGLKVEDIVEHPQPKHDINWQDVCLQMLNKQITAYNLRKKITSFNHETDIFVPLGLMQPKTNKRKEKMPFPDGSEGMKEYELQKEEITKNYEYEQFLEQVINQQTKNLAIIGEPGAGKTTWLTKIAEYLAKNPDHALPICVSLSRLNQDSLEKYLLDIWLKEAIVFIPNVEIVTTELKQDLIKQFNQKNVWLLLDGVDEMKEKDAPLSAISKQLQGFINNTRIILTCRLNVWQSNPHILANFDHYRTLVFNGEQVQDFILQWFGKSDQLLLGETLDKELIKSENARILDLVKNPLRLAMLCQSWYFEQGNLPETKASLYKQFVKVFYQWKQDAFPTTYQQRQNLHKALGNLALIMLDESVSLTESVVREILTDDEFNLATQLGWLNLVYRNRNEEDVFAFFHFTFAEYFAACAIDDWDYFLPRNHVDKPVDPPLIPPSKGGKPEAPLTKGGWGDRYRIFEKQWKEVYLLWMGREDIDSNKKESLIKKLVGFKDGCYGDFYGDQAYLKAAIGISQFKICSLADEIVKQIGKWAFGYFDIEKQGWMNFADPTQEYAREILGETDTQKIMRELIHIMEISKEKETGWLDCYLYPLAVNNKTAITILTHILKTTEDEYTRWRVAKFLSGIDLENNRAISVLIDILKNNKYEDISLKAAETLIDINCNTETVFSTLINIIKTTNDKGNLSNAVYILGKIGVEDQTAISTLINILNKTGDKDICRNVVSTLERIAVGDQTTISTLIDILNKTEDKDTRSSVAYTLGKIAVGDQAAISTLTDLVNKTEDQHTRYHVAYTLGKIAVGDQTAISTLIHILNKTEDQDTRWRVASILGKIAIGNQIAISTLINTLNKTGDKDICRSVVSTLERIAVGDQTTISTLIDILNKTEDQDTRCHIASTLEKIAIGDQIAISTLTDLVNKTEDQCLCSSIVDSFGEILGEDKTAIDSLIHILENTEDKGICISIADVLGEIAVGNKRAISALIMVLKNNKFKKIHHRVAYNLMKIAPDGSKIAMIALIVILKTANTFLGFLGGDKDRYIDNITKKIKIGNEKLIGMVIEVLIKNKHIRSDVAKILEKIAIGNDRAIAALIFILETTDDEYTRSNVADSLGKIIKTKNNYLITVSALNKHLTNETYQNNYDLYKNCYKLLWQCAENLTYPEFYQAWHQRPTYHPEMADFQPSSDTATINQLNQQFTDISQLQPTKTVYPLAIDINKLTGENNDIELAKNICFQIFDHLFPDENYPEITSKNDLIKELKAIKNKLPIQKIALIFSLVGWAYFDYAQYKSGFPSEPNSQAGSLCHNLQPEFINFCQTIQNNWLQIAFVTNSEITTNLRTFKADQVNLLGVIQNWLGEIG